MRRKTWLFVRTVAFLLCLSSQVPAADETGKERHIETIACPHGETGPQNTRNSEVSIIELRDGRLLLAYSHFYEGGEDFSASDIRGKTSADGGQTWSAPFLIQPNDAGMNTFIASLLRLREGDSVFSRQWGYQMKGVIAFFYYKRERLVHNNGLFLRTSRDEGQNWSKEIRINEVPSFSDLAFLNNIALQHSSGRIIIPAYANFGGVGGSLMYLSDDGGYTWRRSQDEILIRERVPFKGLSNPAGIATFFHYFVEPTVVELKDGRLMVFGRNMLGRIYRAYSADRGDTWTDPEPTDLASSASPSILKRIPSTGDLVCVWNQVSAEEIRKGWSRCRMSVAISRDDGKTWEHFKNLESLNDVKRIEPPPVSGAIDAVGEERARKLRVVMWTHDREPLDPKVYYKKGYPHVDYPSCTFTSDDHVVISYGVYGIPGKGGEKVVVHPVSWLYQD